MSIGTLQFIAPWLFVGLMLTAFIWIGWIPEMDKAEFTHKGWFGLCPVYMKFDGEDDVTAVERSLIFYPLFWLSEQVWIFFIGMRGAVDPDYEPSWPFLVTGEL